MDQQGGALNVVFRRGLECCNEIQFGRRRPAHGIVANYRENMAGYFQKNHFKDLESIYSLLICDV